MPWDAWKSRSVLISFELFLRGTLFGFAIFLCAERAVAVQTPAQTSSDLIALLLRPPSDDPLERLLEAVQTCGERAAAADRDSNVARALVSIGASALPDLEHALNRIEKRGPGPGLEGKSAWLLYAYVNIAGRDALPVLKRMLANPLMESLRATVDSSIALALGLTSYVDSLRPYAMPICGPQEPTGAFDNFLVDWMTGDRNALEKDLGPESVEALGHMRDLPGNVTSGGFAIGYRFEPDEWSESHASLREGSEPARQSAEAPVFETAVTLSNRDGQACGSTQIRFLRVPADGLVPAHYLIESSNLADLARLISVCTPASRRSY